MEMFQFEYAVHSVGARSFTAEWPQKIRDLDILGSSPIIVIVFEDILFC